MITIKLKQCCYGCKHPDIDVNEDRYDAVYINNIEFVEERTDCTIYCRHAKVCKAYLESENDYGTSKPL